MMMGGGDPGAAAGGGGYPTAPPHMGMGMGMGMPPPPPGFPPQAGAGAGAQQHSSGFVTGEAAAAMAGKKPKKFVRVGASKDETWEDPTLNEWPDSTCGCVVSVVGAHTAHSVPLPDRLTCPFYPHCPEQTTSGSSAGTWATT